MSNRGYRCGQLELILDRGPCRLRQRTGDRGLCQRDGARLRQRVGDRLRQRDGDRLRQRDGE